jgi:hypothetical protein
MAVSPAPTGIRKGVDSGSAARYPRGTSYTNSNTEAGMPSDGPRLEEDECFSLFVLVAQTKDAILKARQIEYERFGISNERRALLWIIQSYGDQATPAQIARRIFRELQSITEMLKRMESDGLVTRSKGARC